MRHIGPQIRGMVGAVEGCGEGPLSEGSIRRPSERHIGTLLDNWMKAENHASVIRTDAQGANGSSRRSALRERARPNASWNSSGNSMPIAITPEQRLAEFLAERARAEKAEASCAAMLVALGRVPVMQHAKNANGNLDIYVQRVRTDR